jgi:hypothetical protein
VVPLREAGRCQKARRNGLVEHFAMQAAQRVALRLPRGGVIVGR